MTILDNFLKEVDYALNILLKKDSSKSKDKKLNKADKRQSQRVMRVNHMGEICAQGLYRGQAFTTKDSNLKNVIVAMCNDERDHLTKCSKRISQLSGRVSYINPLWYLSSFILGAYVGRLDKDKSLGFIHETEEQVEAHLDEYKKKLPKDDIDSQKVLEEIKVDETKHKNTAKANGHAELDDASKKLMSITSQMMKKISYYI